MKELFHAKKNLPIKVNKIDVTKDLEAAEEHNIVACPTLVFCNFMKVCGNCEQEELEELVSGYISSSFEVQTPQGHCSNDSVNKNHYQNMV